MINTGVNITIGQFQFDLVHEFEVSSSWKNLTDTASITLPAALKFEKENLKDLIKKGDQVKIAYSYDDRVYTCFEGYVSAVQPSVPVVIEAEDLMWKLKQTKVNDVAKNETILSFLQRNLPDYQFDCYEVQLPHFIARKITGAKLLDQIKSDFGLRSFVREGKVVVGKQYDADFANEVPVILNYTIKSDDLEYKSADDVKLNITGISNMSSGVKHEVQVGDPDGETRTLNFFDIPKDELKELTEKEAERFIYDGFRGSLELFGEPFCRHGDIIKIQDDNESDKVGLYYVDEVIYTGGINGYTQKVTLGARA